MQLLTPQWKFVRADLDAGDLAALEPAFAELQQRPLLTADQLENWLLDESELQSRIGAELARRYIRMTCHTDDPAAQQGYLLMEQQVLPRVKLLADALDTKFLSAPALAQVGDGRFDVLVRKRRTQSEIFRPANTELQKQEAELQTRQQALMGSVTVQF